VGCCRLPLRIDCLDWDIRIVDSASLIVGEDHLCGAPPDVSHEEIALSSLQNIFLEQNNQLILLSQLNFCVQGLPQEN